MIRTRHSTMRLTKLLIGERRPNYMASLVHKDDYYETPEDVMLRVRQIAGNPDVDLCASPNNAKATIFIDEDRDALATARDCKFYNYVIFCNPPRSKNAAFVNLCYDLWKDGNEILLLMCWQDLGYRYGEKIYQGLLRGYFEAHNLGKVRFDKDGKASKFVSRNTYFLCHMGNVTSCDVSLG